MRELRIFGMRRSGNHAIIEWIASHFDKTLHYNECWGWDRIENKSQHVYGNKNANALGLTIYSYEDFCPSEEEIKDSRSLLILRDWYNMMSSRIISNRNTAKHRHAKNFNNKNVLGVWLQYIDMYKSYQDKFILYNKWVTDPYYRQIVSNIFKLNTNQDKYTTKLPSSGIGCGSSFDNNGTIDTNMVNIRYKLLKDKNPNFYESILNDQVIDPCKKIFNIEI